MPDSKFNLIIHDFRIKAPISWTDAQAEEFIPKAEKVINTAFSDLAVKLQGISPDVITEIN